MSHSKSVEDFLKAVYSETITGEADRATTTALAGILDILPPSVTDMARRLSDAGLVDYRPYRGVSLTDAGREIALKIIRRHRLIELYLVQRLGYALHEVHHEAENLEHAVSDRFIEAIAEKLGDPTVDPHGDPIPTAEGEIMTPVYRLLSDLQPGEVGRVQRFMASNDVMLQHMLERGFVLGATVRVEQVDPFDGPITVSIDDQQQVIGYAVAQCIHVTT
jgi:DtxR family transcriptional regulator, Mn-dependent transcriptional regulator